MKCSTLIRLSGLAAILGGILLVMARVSQVALFGDQPPSVHAASHLFVPYLGIPALLGTIFYLLGVVGLYARQAEKAGGFGLLAFLVAFVGISLTIGVHWTYAFASPFIEAAHPGLLDTDFSAPGWGVLGTGTWNSYLIGMFGWLLMGISTLTTKVLPRWVGITVVASLVIAAVVPLEITGIEGIIGNVIFASGLFVCGYALWAGLEVNGQKRGFGAA